MLLYNVEGLLDRKWCFNSVQIINAIFLQGYMVQSKLFL